jgi:hypothetical protein
MKNNSTQNNKRKCNYERVQVTLDMCHNKNYDKFKDTSQKIKQNQKELDKLNEKISHYKRSSFSNLTDDELEIYHNLLEKKKVKEDIIKELNSMSEIDYLTKTSDILFEYYDILDKHNNNKKNQICNILDFFGNYSIQDQVDNSNLTSISRNDENSIIDYSRNRAKLMDSYLSYTDNEFIDNSITNENDICDHCGSSDLNILLHEGIMFCNDCNTTEYIITDNDKPSYKEPPKEISYFSYKRINHFNESVFIKIYILMRILLF